ncbi:TRAP transporter large permease [Thermodesulfobacteriota bacterium]
MLLVFLIILCILGMPIGFALGISSTIYYFIFLFPDVPISIIPQRMCNGLDKFPLLALPFYIFAGVLMNNVGATERIFTFCNNLIGHIKGGLGQVNILASIIFSGMSGATVADAAGLGVIEIKAMTDAGYDRGFSSAITAASAIIGPIIPPSVIMIIFAVLVDVSIAKMFVAGIVPGLLMGASMMIWVYFVAVRGKEKLPTQKRAPMRKIIVSFFHGFLSLITPLIIVGSILSGIITPTEAGAIAVAYSILLGICYKTLNLKIFLSALKDSVEITVATIFVITGAFIFGWIIALSQFPSIFIQNLMSLTNSPTLILMLYCLGLIFLGCFMSTIEIVVIISPVMIELAGTLNLDLVYFGVASICFIELGTITPPVGSTLYAVTKVSGLEFETVARKTVQFYPAIIFVASVAMFYPPIVSFLPKLFGW